MMVGACGQNGNDAAGRGKQVYLTECIACHNIDPAKDGPLGPAVKGSSQELLEARVLRGTYPPGYTPKRSTALMPAQPKLAPKIPDLAALLR
jgi:mono/diheme cytochrome c family protein